MKLPINWFDIVVLLVLATGVSRGRKRGLSEELITMIQWVLLVVLCAFTYKPIGQAIVGFTFMGVSFSLLFSYIIAYLFVAAVFSGLYLAIKRSIGGKLLGSDVFGKGEYYFGMPAGMIRFACILLSILALVNARFYTSAELEKTRKYVEYNYGSNFFPTLYEAQQNIFHESFIGPFILKYGGFLLIDPTPTEVKEFHQKDFQMP